jgi:hypothetical protein
VLRKYLNSEDPFELELAKVHQYCEHTDASVLEKSPPLEFDGFQVSIFIIYLYYKFFMRRVLK